MNPTIIKEWWLASWEVKVGMIALFIAGLTSGDIGPYIMWLPGDAKSGVEGFVLANWGFITIAIMWALRVTKTSTKLVINKSDADSPEVVAAAKASLKAPSPADAAKAAATLEAYNKANSPKV